MKGSMNPQSGAKTRNGTRIVLLASIVVSAIVAAGCTLFDPDYAYVTREDSTVRLVADSRAVRGLLTEAAMRDAALNRSQQNASAEERSRLTLEMQQPSAQRRQLISAMAQLGGVVVTGKHYFRELEQSTAGCDIYPISSATYVRVRVTTGPSKGSQGWACSRDVQPVGAWVM